MKINRNNYEAWLLDLIEGRLSPEETQLLRDFLLLNPDCGKGLEDLHLWELETETVSFQQKDNIKKEFPDSSSTLTESNFDMFSIARIEGDLTDSQVADHRQMVSSSEDKSGEWDAWQQTKMPVEHIVFERKKQLKKAGRSTGRVILISISAAAAVIAILLVLARMDPISTDSLRTQNQEALEAVTEQEIAENNTDVEHEAAKVTETRELPSVSPAAFVIRKHQDPPELTGQKKGSGQTPAVDDAGKQQEMPDVAEPGPARLVLAEHQIFSYSASGSYDRIEPFEILSGTTITGSEAVAYEDRSLLKSIRKYTDENDISLLSLADAGITGLRRITGSEMELNVARDDRGETTGFRFQSRWLNVEAPVEKSK